MIYLFLAHGFEETEAIVPIDLLRRAGKDVKTVTISHNSKVSGSHGILVTADKRLGDISLDDMEMIILPGGMPGTLNLNFSDPLECVIDYAIKNNKYIGAICAAPSVLGNKGLLEGKKVTCYPGFEDRLRGAEVVNKSVVVDGKLITARGAGVATEFGLALVEALCGKEKRDEIAKSICFE